MAKKFSQFPSAASISPGDSVVGLKDGANTRFSFATFLSAIQSLFVPTSRKVNNKALTTDITLNASDVGAVATSAVGAADGVASLDNTGKVPTSQLPSSSGPEPATATPLMDGTGAVGASTKYAREDHEHPVDTNKQNKITASGILMGDGQGGVTAATAGTDYQAPLTFDNTPTASSTNPVQSGGVYSDVRTRVPNIGKGKNLFRNPWFRVNQRGITSLNLPSTSGYTCDGWVIYRSNFVQNADNSVTITIGSSSYGFIQVVPLNQLIPGEKYTLSARGTTQTAYITFTMPSTSDYIGYLSSGIRIWVGVYANRYEFWFTQSSGISFTLTRVKLELGEESTLDGDVEPDYEYELYRCITSTADPSDTYANKSLATEQQLAYVETGTTASQNYAAGTYICWQSLLYTADTAIANGATFYTSGGNKNLTERVGGGLNEVLFVDIPYNSFEWYTGLPAFRALYTVPTGYYIAAINVFFTNGSAIAGSRYSSGYIYIVGLNGRGQAIDSTYEFVCTVMLRRT